MYEGAAEIRKKVPGVREGFYHTAGLRMAIQEDELQDRKDGVFLRVYMREEGRMEGIRNYAKQEDSVLRK